MKRVLLLIGLLMVSAPLMLMHGQASLRPRGDVNCDWEVTIADINALFEAITTGMTYHGLYTYAYDINSDKEINIADLNALVGAVLGDELKPVPTYSGTLPVMFINTEGHKDIISKEEYLQAQWWLDNMGIDSVKPIGSAEEPLSMLIRGRGNYTWHNYDKKSFRLKLDEKQTLLGMHSNRHWCLLAHPDDNRAKLKNTVGFELSRQIGLAYTPAQEPVEVVLNGQYIGLYFLTEKIRVDQHRVDIEEQMDGETVHDYITGGWLLEITNMNDDNTMYFVEQSENDVCLGVTPKSPENLSWQQTRYIRNLITAANEAIYTDDKTSTDWEKYIDIDTLAMYYIMGEIMDDLEYFAGSCYMHKHRGDSTKLIFGPVWDFGNAFQRHAIYGVTEFDKFIYQQPTKFTSHWIEEICKFPHFQEKVREHWQVFCESGFISQEMDQFIDDFVDQITPAFNADGLRWSKYDIKYQKKRFKSFIHNKIDWLNTQWDVGPRLGG